MWGSDKELDNPLKTPRGDITQHFLQFLQGPSMATPVSDLLGNILSSQEKHTLCANMEMMMLNCLEQYGYNRGVKQCGGYIQDLHECNYHQFEQKRIAIMNEERKRQYLEGKRKERYEPCPAHL